jgi:hypothetical protein
VAAWPRAPQGAVIVLVGLVGLTFQNHPPLSSRIRLDDNAIIDGWSNPLLADKVAFGLQEVVQSPCPVKEVISGR